MRFFTWRNVLPKAPDLLMLSAARQGICIENAGWGQPFLRATSKIDWLLKSLNDVPRDELVLCTDSFDVIYSGDERAIVTAFLSLNTDIVFAAERWYSHQESSLKRVFDAQPAPFLYRYLNSGTIMGYSGALCDMLNTLMLYRSVFPRQGNDQWFFGKYFCGHHKTSRLDYDCRLFWCTAGEWADVKALTDIENGRIRNRRTASFPCVIHVPWPNRYRYVLVGLARKLALIA
jgi:hypothetical protein